MGERSKIIGSLCSIHMGSAFLTYVSSSMEQATNESLVCRSRSIGRLCLKYYASSSVPSRLPAISSKSSTLASYNRSTFFIALNLPHISIDIELEMPHLFREKGDKLCLDAASFHFFDRISGGNKSQYIKTSNSNQPGEVYKLKKTAAERALGPPKWCL